MSNERELLSSFFNKIWRDKEGFAYVALKSPSGENWQQKFFEWPMELDSIVQTVLIQRTHNEVYFAPALFRVASSKKEDVLGSFCFWVEFDGELPVEFGDLPKPSIVVQTSTETHQHLYWCVDNFLDAEEIDMGNKYLSYTLGADMSGWDASQVLRPPQTLNHKKQRQAILVASTENTVDSVAFLENLAKIDLPKKYEPPAEIPYLPDVLRKYAFPTEVWNLFVEGVQQDRSAGLMRLGYFLAEIGLTDPEMYSMLVDADSRWGKFAKRNDQSFRLSEIITIARVKYPFKSRPGSELVIVTIGDKSLLATEYTVDWLWEGILNQGGYLLLTGPTGIGKSQLSLNLATHLVLGQDFLNRKVYSQKKVAFVSLEMGHVEVKYVRQLQTATYGREQMSLLEDGLRHFIRGYPIPFNRPDAKLELEAFVEREEIECVIFDSLGSMTVGGELAKEADAKDLMDWVDHLRNNLGLSVIIIHHNRKAQVGNKTPKEIADIYGSQYFTARATSVGMMRINSRQGLVELAFPKVRMAPPIKPFLIRRDDNLNFIVSDQRLIIVDEEEIDLTDTNTTTESKMDFDF